METGQIAERTPTRSQRGNSAAAERYRLAVVIASTRQGRQGPMLAKWFVEQAQRQPELDIDVIDLLEMDLPLAMAGAAAEAVARLGARLAEADAFVIVTPEYNHGYPAPLKAAIDLYRTEWSAKPVGFVSYGGVSGGLRAVEQLRQVFPEVHAMTVRDSVSFANYWELFDEAGSLRNPALHEGSAATMLNRLLWWAAALKSARRRLAYTL